MIVLVIKGKWQWYWKLIAENGRTLAVSERYFSKWNAKRAAKKLADANGYDLRVAD